MELNGSLFRITPESLKTVNVDFASGKSLPMVDLEMPVSTEHEGIITSDVKRLYRTLLGEHFRVMGRKKFYESLDEMQKDLDGCLVYYNTKRPHQGLNMNGRMPETVLKEGLKKRLKNGKKKEVKKAA